jgi:hypothetical protein
MNIKFLFHSLAIISGILAAAFGATSSNNKIVLMVVFFVIAGIFEIAIPFIKNAPITIPELEFSLHSTPNNYANGLEVDGITWEDDFRQYFLKVKNKSKKFEIHDLRLDLDFLGGVVNKQIRLQQGCDNVSFSADGFLNTGIGKNGQINKTLSGYSNNLKISSSKIYQDGYFEIKLVIKDLGMPKNGFFEASYRYLDQNNEQIKWANRYKILRHKNGTMYIDSKNPLKGAVKRSIQMIPAKPLVFKKDGTIEEKK